MEATPTEIAGVTLIRPRVFEDDRGFFLETWNDALTEAVGGPVFVQDNHSRSRRGVLRALHYRVARPQGQLVTLLRGACFDVVVDLRPGSPSFGRWTGVTLREDGVRQIYMPPGCAHGFYALSDWCDLHYKVTERYDVGDARSVRWDDPEIGIDWPLDPDAPPLIAEKDSEAPFLCDLGVDQLPQL